MFHYDSKLLHVGLVLVCLTIEVQSGFSKFIRIALCKKFALLCETKSIKVVKVSKDSFTTAKRMHLWISQEIT